MNWNRANNAETELTDDDPMPFGKWKGTRMKDVPAEYLHFLWSNGKAQEQDAVANYIRSRIAALRKEYDDGIWD